MSALSRVHVLGYRCGGLQCRYLQQRRAEQQVISVPNTDPHRRALTHIPPFDGIDTLPRSGRWLRFRLAREVVASVVGGKKQFDNPTSRR